MQKRKECFFTGRTDNLHKHHIYAGSRRNASEKWGCFVWLSPERHVLGPYAVHQNPDLDRALKQACQMRFEKKYGHEKFMEVFGKNYLEDYV